jgi:predicted anti-sigma-YlaC factor YlaD
VLGSVASLLTATLYQGKPNMNLNLWNIVSTEIYILHMLVVAGMMISMGKLKSSL